MNEDQTKDVDVVDEKVEEFMNKFHIHGMGCGEEIAKVARSMHLGAFIIPLYRSCIVIEQSEEDKKDGNCTIHCYADPHWLGKDIDIESLKLGDFHSIYKVKGDRQGPICIKEDQKRELNPIEE
jgi:hypothetical protein